MRLSSSARALAILLAASLGQTAAAQETPQAGTPGTKPAAGEAARTPAPTEETGSKDRHGSQGRPQASVDWKSAPDYGRHLMIMGTMDGLASSATGTTTCFRGKNNADIADLLDRNGFQGTTADSLARTLKLLGEECPDTIGRNYTTQLLQQMPDNHLTYYLGAVIGAWQENNACSQRRIDSALEAATTAIFSSPPEDDPVLTLRAALATACPRN